MKFGFRTPSLKKRIAARTSVKRYVRHDLGLKAPRGYGWLTNPKKAAYNRVYNRTTVGCGTLITIIFLLMMIVSFAVFAHGQNGYVIAENANLRGTPRQTGKVIAELPEGESFEVIKQSSAWFLVQTADYVGWLHGNTIRLITTANKSEYVMPEPRTLVPVQPGRTPASNRMYIRGPRGGCYYINGSGRKTYVDRSLCG